ncbi:MAG: hypothetical protein LBJ67_10205 [Planctomycetaceae bacterium]|nr:hypothetical protein [Planctomycetaceae bacterium]
MTLGNARKIFGHVSAALEYIPAVSGLVPMVSGCATTVLSPTASPL